MADNATIRLNKVLRELNISLDRAVDYLGSKGHDIDARPTTKISNEVYQVLLDEFQTDMSKKVASKEVGEEKRKEKEAIRLQLEQEQEEKKLAREKRAEKDNIIKGRVELTGPKTVGKIDLDAGKKTAPAQPVKSEEAVPEKTAEKTVEKAPEKTPEKTPKKVEEKTPEKVVKEEPKVAVSEKGEVPEAKKEEVAPKQETVKFEEVKEAKEGNKDEAPAEQDASGENEIIATKYQKLSGPKIMGDKIDRKSVV